jgi:hypothetical protein
MLGMYLRELARQAVKSSWAAANGLEGAAIAGSVMIWRGVIGIFPGEAHGAQVANWLLSFMAYAAISWAVLFLFRVAFIAPFQVWKAQTALLDAATDAAEDRVPPKVTPNYQAWRHVEKFTVFQAAHLWAGREPKGGSLHSDAVAWEKAVCSAIRTGKLEFIPRPLRPGPYSMHDITAKQIEWDQKRQQENPDSATEVSREQLVRFAKNNGEKPKFLDD